MTKTFSLGIVWSIYPDTPLAEDPFFFFVIIIIIKLAFFDPLYHYRPAKAYGRALHKAQLIWAP